MKFFKSFFAHPKGKTIYDLAQTLPDDQQYFNLLLRSLKEPVINNVQMPGFPDAAIQSKFVGSTYEDALREGFRFYRVLQAYHPANPYSRVLDFGCGWGRISRFFFRSITSENFWGIDVDPEIISFCARNMHHGSYRAVQPLPPTEFAANSFDLIFAYSVFSHLAEAAARSWVNEFARLLKPGGLLVATTQGRSFLDLCESKQGKIHETEWHNKLARSFLPIAKAKEEYDQGKFLFEPTGENDHTSIRNRSYYGETLIPPEYIRREYTRSLKLVDFIGEQTFIEKAQTKLPQALFLLQKPV